MPDAPDTIVLIHGLWMTPRSWEHWAERYRGKGYNVLAPAWPGMEAEVEAINVDPSPLEELDVETIVDHYEEIIGGLASPPIIMGHSFGGGFTQILLDRGVGAAGVGIAPAPSKACATCRCRRFAPRPRCWPTPSRSTAGWTRSSSTTRSRTR